MPGRVGLVVKGSQFAGQSLTFADLNKLIKDSNHIKIAVEKGPALIKDRGGVGGVLGFECFNLLARVSCDSIRLHSRTHE